MKPDHLRRVLRICLLNIGLDPTLYDMHSTRAERALDLLKASFSIAEVKIFGRWKSSAVYRYLKY